MGTGRDNNAYQQAAEQFISHTISPDRCLKGAAPRVTAEQEAGYRIKNNLPQRISSVDKKALKQ
jgi:hypothetical protein